MDSPSFSLLEMFFLLVQAIAVVIKHEGIEGESN
jgi:hypothetical protein